MSQLVHIQNNYDIDSSLIAVSYMWLACHVVPAQQYMSIYVMLSALNPKQLFFVSKFYILTSVQKGIGCSKQTQFSNHRPPSQFGNIFESSTPCLRSYNAQKFPFKHSQPQKAAARIFAPKHFQLQGSQSRISDPLEKSVM